MLQVKSGTLFDNVLVADDPEYAKKLVEETWGKQKDVCIICFLNLIFFPDFSDHIFPLKER